MEINNNAKKQTRYVVTRDEYRVSDIEYQNREDASNEYIFWNNVVKKWPDGTKIDIVELDRRKHRVHHVK